jgi:hypothetical protein
MHMLQDEPIKPPPEDQPIRFVYDDNDLLDVISGISNPNHTVTVSKQDAAKSWGLIKVEVDVKTLAQLRQMYRELDPCTGTPSTFVLKHKTCTRPY